MFQGVFIAYLVLVSIYTTSGMRYEAEFGTLQGNAVITDCATASGEEQVDNVGTTTTNEIGALIFDVNVMRGGVYTLDIDYISKSTNGASCDITINSDPNSKQNVLFPSSGPLCDEGGSPAMISANDVSLLPGINTIQFDNPNSRCPMIDAIGINLKRIKYEAEDAILSGTAVITSCPTACGGSMVSHINVGTNNYVEFSVPATKTKTHHMTVSYMSRNVRLFVISVNGGSSQQIGFPETGDWCDENGGVFKEYTISVDLEAGINKIRFSAASTESESPFLDYIMVEEYNYKKGLIYGNVVDGENDVGSFTEYISWYYRYSPYEPPELVSWATQNGLEYVPMIGYAVMSDITGKKCRTIPDADRVNQPLCSYSQVLDAVNSNDMSRVKYVMSSNEPWNPNDGNISPEEEVYKFSHFVQPLKDDLDIQLVSANVKQASEGMIWMEAFLKACFDDEVCDVDKIDVISVHEYKCKETYWNNKYDAKNGYFFNQLKAVMGQYGGKNWVKWIDSRPIWVTETNCFWESVNPNPSNIEQCEAITRQSHKHGVGSLQFFAASERIERFAWWTTTVSNPVKTQLLIDYETRSINPAGFAYMRPYDATDC